jgi:transcriptional regulator with XRE-family HTH domain
MIWTKRGLKRSSICNSHLIRSLRKQKGWTQADLADATRRCDRLISKAEAGHPVSASTIQAIADAFSTTEHRIQPVDLIYLPRQRAQEYIQGLYLHQQNILDALGPFFHDQICFQISGDPAVIPFAGRYQGLAEIERYFQTFFACLELPPTQYKPTAYEYLAQGNVVIAIGESWLQEIEVPSPLEPENRNNKVVRRFLFDDGRLISLDELYDTWQVANFLKHGTRRR